MKQKSERRFLPYVLLVALLVFAQFAGAQQRTVQGRVNDD